MPCGKHRKGRRSRWSIGLSGTPQTLKMWEGSATVRSARPITRELPRADRYVDVAVKYLAAAESERVGLPKILQFSSEDKYTKYQICQLFAEIMGLNIDAIEPNTQGNDPNAKVQRPYDCHLSTKALKDLGINVATMDFMGFWRREMRAFRK